MIYAGAFLLFISVGLAALVCEHFKILGYLDYPVTQKRLMETTVILVMVSITWGMALSFLLYLAIEKAGGG